MNIYKIQVVYFVLGVKYSETGFIRERDSVEAHRALILSLPKEVHIKKVVIKEHLE